MLKPARSIAALILICAACSKDASETHSVPGPTTRDPKPARRLAACDLVTVDEMTTILGKAMKAERVDANTCQYTVTEGMMPYVELKLEWGGAEAQAIAAGLFNRVEKGMAKRFEGVGDSATSIGPVLYVRRGPDLLTMQLVGVDDFAAVAKAIYAIASPRLPAVDAAAAAAASASAKDAAAAIGEAVKLIPGGDAGGGIAEFAQALGALSGEGAMTGLPVDSRSVDPRTAAAPAAAVSLGHAEHIPLVQGLTITSALSGDDGDYEVIFQVTATRPESYDLVVSADDVPALGRPIAVLRRVRNQDQRGARTMRDWFGEDDDEEYPGTTPFFSSTMIEDLRTEGRMPFTLIDSTQQLYRLGGFQTLTGMITRIERESTRLDVIVNGRLERLPAIHARGLLSDRATTSKQVELWVLDDRVNPLVLQWRSETGQSRVVKIEYPVAARASEIERTLEKGETVDVYGIYFEFGSATIRPQSAPVLEEIAAIMRRHPDWVLDVAGFTDSIGGDVANLELSQRRTAAVKTELSSRFGIDADRLHTAGYGEGSPKATNDTPEGRAQNRRVELTRRRSS